MKRNQAWLPILQKELNEPGAFIAVGVNHLFGQYGLLESLRKSGVTVRRVGASTSNAEDVSEETSTATAE